MKINNVSSAVNNSNNKVNKNQNLNNNGVAFKGSMGDSFSSLMKNQKKNLADFFTLKRQGPMSRNLFTLNAFVFLLGTRFITSRDKNEKRETLVRDVPSIFFAIKGVPMFQNWAAGRIQKHTGFALFEDPAKKSDGTASYAQMEDWYKFNEKDGLQSGFKGFCERLSSKNGDLKKIFSTLSNDIKKDLSGDKFTSKNNEEFLAKLKSNSEIENKILTALKDGSNNAAKQASFLKTMSAVVGYGLTLGLLGLFIPKMNIAITEKINKDKKAKEQEQSAEQAK